MNSVLEILFLRRPSIDYISPPVCEFDFSSSGGPVIVLDALGRLLAPSGFVLGGRGRFRLSWNHYVGALCYTVYKAVDSSNPFGDYVVVAECIEDPEIDLEPEGPGCYRVSAITENGETELSDPICGVGSCPFIISGASPSTQTVNEGDTVNLSAVVGNADTADSYVWFKDGVSFSETTSTTQEILQIPNATPANSGSYTLLVGNELCEDTSAPASVTVNAGPPCTEVIQIVDFTTVADIGSDGTLIGTGAGGTRPFYHQNGISKDIRTEIDSSPITASQLGTAVTASDSIFQLSDEGKIIRFSTSELAEIVTFISPLQVTVTPSQSVPATTFVIRGNTLGGATGQGIVANGNNILGGLEEAFGVAGFHVFWLDLSANEIRDLGAGRVPSDMSEDGFMVMTDQNSPPNAALIYDPNAQTFTDMGDLGGGAVPVAINASHVVALQCLFGGIVDHACRWNAGTLTDIHPAFADPFLSDVVWGINSSGAIVGTYGEVGTGDFKTFLNTGGASFDIGSLGGEVLGTEINDAGTIAGSVEVGSGTFDFRPFLRTLAGGTIELIPQLPATTGGSADGINADGWIVGAMDGVAFLYRGGVTSRILDLIPGGTLWTNMVTADFISDSGVITGLGIYDGGVERYWLQLCS